MSDDAHDKNERAWQDSHALQRETIAAQSVRIAELEDLLRLVSSGACEDRNAPCQECAECLIAAALASGKGET